MLLAADGMSNTALADQVGVSRPTVLGWWDRYVEGAWLGWRTSRARVGQGRFEPDSRRASWSSD
ncbi:MAG: helix-turn-helix domain-containing protein, partial [Nocardioidaceae bacterium]|nr:helix-turn-helix domain-containing protein [Nocardioidaceae bacterium]